MRFKDSKDPFRIVIVRDMWLTGFDAPCLHTMYADKPMRGHGLMQAIARVNRVFRDKPGGLVVDYLGLADQLKHALATYTESGGQGSPSIDTAQAIAVMLEKHDVACDMMHGFNWDKWTTGTSAERLGLIPAGQEHILEQEDGKKRFVQVVTELSRAFALCAASDDAIEIPRRHRLLPGHQGRSWPKRPGRNVRRKNWTPPSASSCPRRSWRTRASSMSSPPPDSRSRTSAFCPTSSSPKCAA